MSSLTLLSVICIPVAMSLKTGPRVPIHGAKAVQEILSNHLNYDGSLLSFLKGTKSNDTDGLHYANYNLDVNVLDIDNLRKLINLAKTKYKRSYRRMEARAYETAGFKTHKRIDLYNRNVSLFDIVMHKIYNLMLQSIYTTKYRIEDTRTIRKHFNDQPSYKVGLLYTSMAHYINKMESLYAQARFFAPYTHFIWYLIIYEKLLQCDTDIDFAAGRLYQLSDQIQKVQNLPKFNANMFTHKPEGEEMPVGIDPQMIAKYSGHGGLPGPPRPPTAEEIENIKQEQLNKMKGDLLAGQMPSVPSIPTFNG